MSSFNSGDFKDDSSESYDDRKLALKQSDREDDQKSQRFRSQDELDLTFLQQMNLIAEGNLKNGNVISALENYEKCLDHFIESCRGDPSHPAFVDYFRETLKTLNDQALKLLREDKIEMSQLILEKCEEFTNGSAYGMFPTSRNLTFNHLACCYRRIGKLDIALKYLHQALEFVTSDDRMETAGITHINLCAILSQMNNHQKALEHAKKAVYECSFEIIKATSKSEKNQGEYSKKVTTLAIAYHNLGVEEDFCGNLEAAKEAYYKAFEMIERTNGLNDPLVKKFKAAYIDVKNKYMQVSRQKKSPIRLKQTPVESKPARPLSSYNGAGRKNVFSLPNPKNTITKMPNPASKIYFAHNRIVIQSKNNGTQFNDGQMLNAPYNNQNGVEFPISRKASTGSIRKDNLNINNSSQYNNPKLSRPQTANVKGRRQITIDVTPASKKLDLDAVIRTHPHKNFLLKMPEDEPFGRVRQGSPDSDAKERDFMSNIEQQHRSALQKNFHNANEAHARKSNTPSSLDLQNSNIQLPVRVNPQATGQQQQNPNSTVKPRIRRFRNAPTNSSMSVEKRTHLAAVKIQKHFRGYFVRRRYRNYLRQKRFIMLYHSIDKLALDPDDQNDTYNYHVSVWYDLFDERMIFNVIKQQNRIDRYATKVKYPLPEDTTVKLFANNIKALAVVKVQAMYLEGNQLKFKMIKEEKKVQRPVKIIQYKQPIPQNLVPEEIVRTVTPKAQDNANNPTASTPDNTTNDPKTKNKNSRAKPNSTEAVRSEPLKKIVVQIPHQKPQMSAKMIKRVQALIRGRLSRSVYFFLDGLLYLVRDALSFRHQGHWLNARILQKYLQGRKLEPNPKEFVVITNDWTDCVNFNLITIPASHFASKEVKVKELKESFEINLFTHELYYQPVQMTTISYQFNSKTPNKSVSDTKIQVPTITINNQSSNLGFDEKTIKMIVRLQKVMRGHLWRKKYNFFDLKYYKVLFSKSFMRDKHVINLRIMERIYKDHSPKSPEKVVMAHDFTDKVRYNVLKYNSKALGNASSPELTLDLLLNSIIFDVKTHTIEYKDAGKESQSKEKPVASKDQKPELATKKSAESNATGRKTSSEFESQKKANGSNQEISEEKVQTTSKNEKIKAEETPVEELPDLNDPEIMQSTLAIQKAYLKKKNKGKPAEEAKKELDELKQKFSKYDYGKKPDEFDPKIQEKKPAESKERNKSEQKQEAEEEEEMPDLNDPEVQHSAMLIQKAFLKKKNKDAEKTHQIKNVTDGKKPKQAAQDKLKQDISPENTKNNEEIGEELPDLNDPEIQQSALAIQKAYLKKKSKEQLKEERKNELEAFKQQYAKYDTNEKQDTNTKDIPPKQEDDAEELPDLNDPEVQQSALAIQKAYLKKKNKAKETEEKKKESEKIKAEFEKYNYGKKEEKPQEADTKIESRQHEEAEEELPDLNDPEVQQSAMLIQKAYLKKKNKQSQGDKGRKKDVSGKKNEENSQENEETKELKPKSSMKADKKPQPEKKVQKEEEDEELPDLNDPEVQQSALAIQKAYLKKKNKQKNEVKNTQKADSPQTTDVKGGKAGNKPSGEQVEKKEAKDQDEELPDLNDPEVQQSALAIQKAYLRKKNKAEQKQTKGDTKGKEPIKQTVSEEKQKESDRKISGSNERKKEEEDEELPDLNDPEVQQSALAIQKAYLKKKNKAKLNNQESEKKAGVESTIQQASEQKEIEGKSKNLKDNIVTQQDKKADEADAEADEELPDLNDPEVQQSALAIQKAYLKKKNKAKLQAQQTKASEQKTQSSTQDKSNTEKKIKNSAPSSQKDAKVLANDEEEEELPDLNDPEVQQSALAIQKAYLRKKNKQKQPEQAKKGADEPNTNPVNKDEDQKVNVKGIQPEFQSKGDKAAAEEEDDELPDLNDPEVQQSAMLIQKAYLKKKNKASSKEEKKKEPEKPAQESSRSHLKAKEEAKGKAEEEEHELPDLNDPDVQNSAMLIQNAYLKKKNKAAQKKVEDNKSKTTKAIKESARSKQDEKPPQNKIQEQDDEELPDLNDPDVQKSAAAIQKAYLRKRNNQKQEQPQENKKPTEERPKSGKTKDSKIEQQAPVHDNRAQNEDEEELPDLNDPEVQQSALAIQKAYLKKKNKANLQVQQTKASEQKTQISAKDKNSTENQIKDSAPSSQKDAKVLPNNEEEELPDLNDPEIQQSTLAIQKAYLRKKNKEKQKEERKKELQELKQQLSKYGVDEKETEPKAEEKISKEQVNKNPEDEEDELPDLNDPEVQQSAMLIQKAYLNKKNKAKQGNKGEANRSVSGDLKKSKPYAQEKDTNGIEAQKKKITAVDGELPDLNVPGIQQSTPLIQDTYLKKKDKQKQAQNGTQRSIVKTNKTASFGQLSQEKAEEEEQAPDLEDPEININSTLRSRKLT